MLLDDDNDAATTLARQRVAEGVKVLDEKVPGWWKVIKLDDLKMSDCHTCMLGQLFGYDTETAIGAAMHGLPKRPASGMQDALRPKNITEAGYFRGCEVLHRVGVDIGCNEDASGGVIADWQDLKCAWADVIAERRASDDEAANE